MIIGAPKCGTTSVHSILQQVPGIQMSKSKEPGFFLRADLLVKGIDYYKTSFFGTNLGPWYGEATPWYIYSDIARDSVWECRTALDPKFIVCLRDPAERAYSMYLDQVRAGWEKRTAEEALKPNEGDLQKYDALLSTESGGRREQEYLRGGMYASFLKPWISLFGMERFLFLTEDDLRSPVETANTVAWFLGLHAINEIDIARLRLNRAGSVRSNLLRDALRRVDISDSAVKRAVRRVVPESLLQRVLSSVHAANRDDSLPPVIGPHLLRTLQGYFGESVLQLEQLTNLDLTRWGSHPPTQTQT